MYVDVLNGAYSRTFNKKQTENAAEWCRTEEGGLRDLHGGRKIREFVRLNRSTVEITLALSEYVHSRM